MPLPKLENQAAKKEIVNKMSIARNCNGIYYASKPDEAGEVRFGLTTKCHNTQYKVA